MSTFAQAQPTEQYASMDESTHRKQDSKNNIDKSPHKVKDDTMEKCPGKVHENQRCPIEKVWRGLRLRRFV